MQFREIDAVSFAVDCASEAWSRPGLYAEGKLKMRVAGWFLWTPEGIVDLYCEGVIALNVLVLSSPSRIRYRS